MAAYLITAWRGAFLDLSLLRLPAKYKRPSGVGERRENERPIGERSSQTILIFCDPTSAQRSEWLGRLQCIWCLVLGECHCCLPSLKNLQ
jgi:hypothetical protein